MSIAGELSTIQQLPRTFDPDDDQNCKRFYFFNVRMKTVHLQKRLNDDDFHEDIKDLQLSPNELHQKILSA